MGTALAPFSGISLTFHLIVLLTVFIYKKVLALFQNNTQKKGSD